MEHELQELGELLEKLDSVKLGDTEDCLHWLSDNKGVFSIGNCYKLLRQLSSRQPTSQVTGLPLKLIWDEQIPARINCFLWKVERQAVQTRLRLHKLSYMCTVF